jgi:hypothetical protein
MSGGSYSYAYQRLDDFADELREVGGCGDYAAPPFVRRAFAEHCRKVARAMHAIEWNDSGDGHRDELALIKAVLEPTAADVEALKYLRDAATKVLAYLGDRKS